MSGHTPGPWHWVNPDNDSAWQGGGRASLRSVKEYGESKTTVVDSKRYTTYALPKFVIGYAEELECPDARLIAAAPDLLKELKRVMSWIDNWSPEFSNDPDWPTDRDAARAAITKATGEAT